MTWPLKDPADHLRGDCHLGINAKSQDENARAAKRLKMMLDADDHPGPLDEPQALEQEETEVEASAIYGVLSHYANRLLGQAYRDAYHKHNLEVEQAIKEDDDNEVSGQAHDSISDDEDASATNVGDSPIARASPAPTKNANRSKARLPGLGGSRQRNRYARTLNHGQEVGVGVIGERPVVISHRNKDDDYADDDDLQDGPMKSLFSKSDRSTSPSPPAPDATSQCISRNQQRMQPPRRCSKSIR